MDNFAKGAVFTGELQNRFKSYITDRCGLYFRDHNLRDLEQNIAARMAEHKFNSPFSYYSYLTDSENKEDEFRELINLLTIKHTYFFRNEPQFQVLRDRILPVIIERKKKLAAEGTKPLLRIWSAGCSSGEEPYSLAIIINELIPDLDNWDIQIIATDASQEALKRARKGVYPESSVKHLPPDYLDKYFEQVSGSGQSAQYAISEQIKRLVSFSYFNLMDEDYPAGFDIIFCRNVTIYFELETTIKVMCKFHSSLYDDGYIFIGYAETLQFLQDKFMMVVDGEAIYYRKSEQVAALPLARAAKEEFELDKILEEISRKQAIADLEAELKKAPAVQNIENIMAQALKSSYLKDYNKALELLKEARQINRKALDPYYLTAEIMINQGRFKDAENELVSALKINPLFAPAHYLQGCLYLETGEIEKAKANFKKALYLDSDLIQAHFYAAQIFKNQGLNTDALREYRNTTKLLLKKEAQDIMPHSGGFNAATLLSVCRDNIERLKIES